VVQPTSAPLLASACNQLGHYASTSSLGNKAYCYAELAVSSLAVAVSMQVLIVLNEGGDLQKRIPGMSGLLYYSIE